MGKVYSGRLMVAPVCGDRGAGLDSVYAACGMPRGVRGLDRR
jgi:hypothetical protein